MVEKRFASDPNKNSQKEVPRQEELKRLRNEKIVIIYSETMFSVATAGSAWMVAESIQEGNWAVAVAGLTLSALTGGCTGLFEGWRRESNVALRDWRRRNGAMTKREIRKYSKSYDRFLP